MAIEWGAWVYAGGNGMRVGLDVNWSGVDSNSSSTTATIAVWTQNQYNYNDNQTVSYGGAIGGSLAYNNTQSSGTSTQRDTKTFTHNYGSNPATYTFTATLSGLYNGGSPTVSVTSTTPTKPSPPSPPPPPPGPSAPSAPNSFTSVGEANQISLSWSAPSSDGGATVTGYTLNRGATNLLTNSNVLSYIDTGLSANTTYSYTVSAVNSAGTGPTSSTSATTLAGLARIWNGSAYVTVVPKIWNGTSWVDGQARIWNGTQWVYGS